MISGLTTPQMLHRLLPVGKRIAVLDDAGRQVSCVSCRTM